MFSPRRRIASLGFALALGVPLLALPAALSTAEASGPATTTAAAARDDTSDRTKVRRCFGRRATIVAGNRGTRIRGTRHRDVIYAGGGHDRINGRGGGDLICGGAGNDVIDGGRGRDWIRGGSGSDLCLGTPLEHRRYHFGCNVHLPSPPSGGAPQAQAPRALEPVQRQSAPPPAASRQQRGTGSFVPSVAYCGFGSGDARNYFISGANTNPSLFAVKLWWVPFNQYAGRWDLDANAVIDTGWATGTIPADGQYYEYSSGGARALRSQYSVWLGIYEVAWSRNGVDFSGYDEDFWFVDDYNSDYFGASSVCNSV